jgi:hypothetical protein
MPETAERPGTGPAFGGRVRSRVPFEKPNRHRRVRLQDVLNFHQRRRAERGATLNQLTEEAGELGLYDGSPADYAPVLKSARRRRARQTSRRVTIGPLRGGARRLRPAPTRPTLDEPTWLTEGFGPRRKRG